MIKDGKYTLYPDVSGICIENRNIDTTKPYWIVAGAIGTGKSVYIEAMRLKKPHMQFLETQRLEILPREIKKNAAKIILIREVYYG